MKKSHFRSGTILSCFKINSRVNNGIGDITDNGQNKSQQSKYIKGGKYQGKIPLKSGLKSKQSHAVQGKNDLNEHGPGEKNTDKG